jgi:hypothetical protein
MPTSFLRGIRAELIQAPSCQMSQLDVRSRHNPQVMYVPSTTHSSCTFQAQSCQLMCVPSTKGGYSCRLLMLVSPSKFRIPINLLPLIYVPCTRLAIHAQAFCRLHMSVHLRSRCNAQLTSSLTGISRPLCGLICTAETFPGGFQTDCLRSCSYSRRLQGGLLSAAPARKEVYCCGCGEVKNSTRDPMRADDLQKRARFTGTFSVRRQFRLEDDAEGGVLPQKEALAARKAQH